VEPVKSTIRTSGRTASSAATVPPGSSATSVTRSGEKPAAASTSRAIDTVIASGRIAAGCGLTTTGFPQASDANRPGYEFQVGNVLHPITRPIPRGTAVNVFSITSGGRLP
jgi:hypothetical protein